MPSTAAANAARAAAARQRRALQPSRAPVPQPPDWRGVAAAYVALMHAFVHPRAFVAAAHLRQRTTHAARTHLTREPT